MAKVFRTIADPDLNLSIVMERKSDGKFYDGVSSWEDDIQYIALTESADFADGWSEYHTDVDPHADVFWRVLDDSDPRVLYDRGEFDGIAAVSESAAGNWPPTLAALKLALRIDDDKTVRDDHLDNARSQAKATIERYCRRRFATAERTFILNGSGEDELQLPDYPITAISSIHICAHIPRDWIDADELDSDYYMINDSNDDEENFIIYRMDGGVFPYAKKNVRVIATVGYSTIPADLYRACLELAMWFYEMEEHHRVGLTSKSQDGGSVSYITDAQSRMPASVIQKIEQYVSFVSDIQYGAKF